MAIRILPPRALVHQLLHYDAATGQFTWRTRPRKLFPTQRAHSIWNARYAGKAAGSVTAAGHLAIAIGNIKYRAHRLAWLYVRGEPVPNLIDHEDRDKLNNRFSNLRAATKSENACNSATPMNNTSGVKGVDLFRGGFRARLKLGGKDIHVGTFDTFEDAAQARFEAASRLYGRFARHE